MKIKGIGQNQYVKQNMLLFFTSTLLLSLMFISFLGGSILGEIMTPWPYFFYAASALSHAACLMLPSLLLGLLVSFIRPCRYSLWLQTFISALICIACFLDNQVYAIYRFHINGFIINMLLGPGANEVFNFDTALYVQELAYLLGVGALSVLAYWLVRVVWRFRQRSYATWGLSLIVGMTLFAHVSHIYGSFMSVAGIVQSAKLLPYYFPTTSYSLMNKLGFHSPNNWAVLKQQPSGSILYPRKALETESPKDLPNILIILIDSWNKRTLTSETMPNLYRFAQEEQWYTNHKSASNGTRSGVYGLFYGLSCYYWEEFEAARVQPLFIRRLLDLGYDIGIYPSATLENPNFAKVLFSQVPSLRRSTPGETSLERDERLTSDYLHELRQRSQSGKPTFSFLFYDLPHSFQLPKELNQTFRPAWDYADYTRLNNDTDARPFFNLYRNTCYQADKFIGRVLDNLKVSGGLDNTIVLVTGDHGQEFNENKHNYWGHNSNFSDAQIGVPLIAHFPKQESKQIKYRTTHYDIIPTLMHDYLGVKNALEDYSMGKLLRDTSPRTWHLVGSNLNYAFIVEGDTILEKTAEGNLDVYDPKMKPIPNYKMNAKKFNEAMVRLNAFFKH